MRLNGFGGISQVEVINPDEVKGRYSKIRVNLVEDSDGKRFLSERTFKLRNSGLRDAFVSLTPYKGE